MARGLAAATMAACACLPAGPAIAALDLAGLVDDTVEQVESSEPLLEPVVDMAEETLLEPVESTVDEVVDEVEGTLDDGDSIGDDPVDDPTTDPDPVPVDGGTSGPAPADPPQSDPVVTAADSIEGATAAEVTPAMAGDTEGVPESSVTPARERRDWAVLGMRDVDSVPVYSFVEGGAVSERPLMERFLEWLGGRSRTAQAVLGGPLLALEILVRALFSAGSGLVAPAAFLAAYLVGLVWERRMPSGRGRSSTLVTPIRGR